MSEVTVKKVLKANARGRILSRSNCGLLPGFFRVFTLQSDSPDDASSPSKYVLALLGEKKRQSRWFAELAALQFLRGDLGKQNRHCDATRAVKSGEGKTAGISGVMSANGPKAPFS